MLISLSSVATAGKDTFCTLFKTHLPKHIIQRFAFADALKEELDPMFKAFGSTAFETDLEKKKLIRPILVSYGVSQRILTNGRHWIDKLEPAVKQCLARNEIAIVTDCRFTNEMDWVKSLGGKTIYIERIDLNGNPIRPPNKEESDNDPFLRANADITVTWPTTDIHSLWPFVEKVTKQLGLE